VTLPRAYVAALAVVAAIFAFTALTALGVVTLESVSLLLFNFVFQVFAVTVLAALGGVFLGMVLAHRMLSSRGFTPFERELLQALAEVRTELQRMQARDEALRERLESLEKRAR
jgi:membrane glycosyltransferase